LDGFSQENLLGLFEMALALSERVMKSLTEFPVPDHSLAGRGIKADECPAPVVDVSNVAWFGSSRPKLGQIQSFLNEFKKNGLEPIPIADTSLRHHIDDQESYENLIAEGTIIQAPAGSQADSFNSETVKVLTSSKIKARVVTNGQGLARSTSQVTCLRFIFVPIRQCEQVGEICFQMTQNSFFQIELGHVG
jgi:hypothetical protein